MYRIAWKSNYTGFEACGEAKEAVNTANANHPMIKHWVEEVI